MNWKAIVYPLLAVLVLGGTYLYTVFKHRQQPSAAERAASQPVNPDTLVIDRQEFPAHFDDVAELAGKSVWVRNGYSMPYYAYTDSRPNFSKVDFAKQIGLLPPAQKLDVKKVIKAAVPASVHDKIEHGDHQAMLVFSLPGNPALYATPTGYMQGSTEQYYSDMLYFYDDPHTIYTHWPKDVWTAIDAHQPKPGMTERQMNLALGMNIQTGSTEQGNRTITYDVNGRQTSVTFVNGHASTIQAK